MIGKEIVYFCNCYYLMLDYDESMKEIVADFVSKEIKEKVSELIGELKKILFEDEKVKSMNLQKIIDECDEMNVEIDEMNEILQEIYFEFQKYE